VASTFTWLDYSEHERRKMLDVIELFGERTTRDELGLGSIRDAFADMLFPGTSTIQTRAKYFLFVPWIYTILEDKGVPSAAVATKARKMETELIKALTATDDKAGIIGGRAKENLQRLPSNVYWQGLAVWGIRVYPRPQDEYHRSLDSFYVRWRTHRARHGEFDGEAQGGTNLYNWHSGLPSVPSEFPNVASLKLKPSEAEYLRERILSHCSGSLLALMVRDRLAGNEVNFAWELTANLPPNIREQLDHGRNFSESMLGAQLLYNLMLAELRKWKEKLSEYRARLTQWWQIINERKNELRTWDRKRFWAIVYQKNPRVSSRARAFVNEWIDLVVKSGSLSAILESTQARQLIERREVQLKDGLARLRNQRALETWPGAAGDGQLDLRWNAARRIASDIASGLEGSKNA
jgi:Family of unknown function (DUF6361)